MRKNIRKLSNRALTLMEGLEQRTLFSSITITSGGTYTGNWTNTNSSGAAVVIDTTQPVTIVNSTIQSTGDLIRTGINGAQLTVKHTTATALNPNVNGKAPGEFVNASDPASIDLEHNTVTNAGGYAINVTNWSGSGSQTIKILNNNIQNTDGRYSNGAGGYQTSGQGTAHVICLNNVKNVAGIQIGWNEIVNQPGQSYLNDIINIYNSSGTSSSPIQISNNFIDGLWAINPATQGNSGSAIITDGTGSDAYVKIFSNTIIDSGNAGIALASGHDIQAYNNTVLSSGYLSTGQAIWDQNVGIYVKNYSGGSFYNVGAYNNTLGYWQAPNTQYNKTGSKRMNNTWFSGATSSMTYGNKSYTGSVTTSIASTELSLWKSNLSSSSQTVGA